MVTLNTTTTYFNIINDYIRPPRHATSLYEKSVSYAGLQLYNMLPINVRELSISQYKIKLKTFLVENPMYDIHEFVICDKNYII